MKIVRMPPKLLTAWRENVSHLVDAEGHLTGKVSRGLENALGTVMLSARSRARTVEQRVAIAGKEHLLRVEVQKTGMNAADLMLSATIDGHRVVSGRDVICAQMLAEHGECQLRHSNGVIVKVIRDPGVHRPSFKESLQVAPRPEHCPCARWGAPHPGHHHVTCPNNRLAPPDEQAPSTAVPEDEVQLLPTEALSALAARPTVRAHVDRVTAARVSPAAVVSQPKPLDPPDSCRNGCLDWPTPKGLPIPAGQHHPTCIFSRDWAVKTAKEIPRWLIELHTGQKLRLATDAEIGEAEVTARKTGAPIIHIDERPFAVVLETELEALPAAEVAPRAPVSPAAEASP